MILTMVIISTMTIICIIRHKTYYDDYSYYILAYYSNYSYYTNYLFQIGWNLWVLEYYTSSITGNLFSMSSPFKAFWENLLLCLLETQEPFCTT